MINPGNPTIALFSLIWGASERLMFPSRTSSGIDVNSMVSSGLMLWIMRVYFWDFKESLR